jgi:hypothetical protein
LPKKKTKRTLAPAKKIKRRPLKPKAAKAAKPHPWRRRDGEIHERGLLIGYARVSTLDQNLALQQEPPHSLVLTPRCHSPSCVPAVASAPPRSMSGSPCSPTPAASSKPTTDIASPTADPKTSDNHNKTGDNAPTSQFHSRALYNVREREVHAGRRLSRATGRSQSITFSGSAPCGAFSRPGRSISMPSRTAAVKTGPVQGRRRLGLDGREHDGTLARHGHGRSPLRSMTLDQRTR